MKKLTKKSMLLKKMLLLMIAIVMMTSVLFGLVACEKEPEEPVYEIKLYDDNWVELERQNPSGPENFTNPYVYAQKFKYDGEKKGYNAKAFKNGEEFSKINYKNYEVFERNRVLNIKMTAWDFPTEKGEYKITYFLGSGELNDTSVYTTPIGKIYGEDLPDLEQRVYIDII